MPTRYETERDLHDLHEYAEPDREISLGTTTILGIFFALALLCAVFFGFGYSLGRRSAAPAPGASEVTSGSESNIPKPAPGSLANQTPATAPVDKPAAGITQSAVVPLDPPNAATQDTQPAPGPVPVKAAASNPRPDIRNESVPKTVTKPASTVPIAAVTSASPSVVQVAAMSHQEDADVVAVDLKRRGYTVAVRRVPQDKLFHVQIGPFANKKDADAMRQHLQADGYNSAIVK